MNATAAAPSAPHLLKLLGVIFGLAVGIRSIIGGGILRTPGAVAELTPSFWWIVGLWLFGGIHTLLVANVLAELSTAIPKAGGHLCPRAPRLRRPCRDGCRLGRHAERRSGDRCPGDCRHRVPGPRFAGCQRLENLAGHRFDLRAAGDQRLRTARGPRGPDPHHRAQIRTSCRDHIRGFRASCGPGLIGCPGRAPRSVSRRPSPLTSSSMAPAPDGRHRSISSRRTSHPGATYPAH